MATGVPNTYYIYAVHFQDFINKSRIGYVAYTLKKKYINRYFNYGKFLKWIIIIYTVAGGQGLQINVNIYKKVCVRVFLHGYD